MTLSSMMTLMRVTGHRQARHRGDPGRDQPTPVHLYTCTMEGVCSSEGVECDYSETSIIDIMMQVPSVEECRQLCQDEASCHYITYFDQDWRLKRTFAKFDISQSRRRPLSTLLKEKWLLLTTFTFKTL